jgi:outer membrane protein TolC
MFYIIRAIAIAATLVSAAAQRVEAQSTVLDSLVARATALNPRILAARARVDAATARIGPAGARPDPMLMAGIQNFPLSEPGFGDFMTMKMIGVSQTIPFPGKRSARTAIAQAESDAARASLNVARLAITREVRTAYFDLAFSTRALDIIRRTQGVVAGLIPVAEARYAAGSGSQSDVLSLQVETARLADEGAATVEERRATLARLNALIDQPSNAPVEVAEIPASITRAAVADSARAITFVSAALGARVTGSPIPPTDSLVALATRNNPTLREHEAMIAAQAARVELARREYLPDIDLSVQYGQRNGFSDMLTATVSVPVPLQRRQKQDAEAIANEADLRALQAEHMASLNTLRADVTGLVSALERDRTQLALYVKAVLPQARAALTSATNGYQANRVEFASLGEAQATLFNYETDYYRALTDFAKTLAELEEQVGTEVIR